MRATLKLIFLSIFLVSSVFVMKPVRAESEDACAIWLCLPAGFPQGCSGAYGEFRHRLKKRRPPLPDLSSCTTGPNGEKSSGRYELGYEEYYPCDEGFELQVNVDEGGERARCVSENHQSCPYQEGVQIIHRDEDFCYYYYTAKHRPKPNYIKMWVDGRYLGQYYW